MAQKKSPHYPVQRVMRVEPDNSQIGTTYELNVERYLSKSNRRLYRQARTYSVKIDIDPDASQVMYVYALADTWTHARALKMAYASYLENGASERRDIKEKNIARWEDFRVLSGLNSGHTIPRNFLTPGTVSPLIAGEFETSLVFDSAGNQRTFDWTGSTTPGSYSILDEYDKAGNFQPSPTTTTGDMPYDDLMADDSAAMANALQVRGNIPPYRAAGTQAPWVLVGVLQSEKSVASSGSRLSTGYFNAPCGIVAIVADTGAIVPEANRLSMTVKAGDYKGVHAPSMLE